MPGDIESFTVEFIETYLPGAEVKSVKEESGVTGVETSSSNGMNSGVIASAPNAAIIAPVATVVGLGVFIIAFFLFRKRRGTDDSDDSQTTRTASFQENLRPSSSIKYTNGKHLTGDIGFPVKSNSLNNEFEIDSLVEC